MIDPGGAASQMGQGSAVGPFGRALVRAAADRDDIVGVTADLAKFTDMLGFAEQYPDRFYNVGLAEQNLVSVAAGLSMTGLTPVATTFAVFLTRRAYDFAAMQIALHGGNVKLACSLVGIGSTFGPSHQGVDDIAHMRALPGMVVIDPCDPVEMEQATIAALELDGPVYLRMLLGSEPVVLDPTTPPFEIGRAVELRAGSDVAIVAGSIMVKRALDAAAALSAEGVSASVLKISTPKPFDGDAVAEVAARTGRVVTAENHSVIGGLFSSVAEALVARGVAARVTAVGMQDEFGSFGTLEYNAERHGLTEAHIRASALRLLDEASD